MNYIIEYDYNDMRGIGDWMTSAYMLFIKLNIIEKRNVYFKFSNGPLSLSLKDNIPNNISKNDCLFLNYSYKCDFSYNHLYFEDHSKKKFIDIIQSLFTEETYNALNNIKVGEKKYSDIIKKNGQYTLLHVRTGDKYISEDYNKLLPFNNSRLDPTDAYTILETIHKKVVDNCIQHILITDSNTLKDMIKKSNMKYNLTDTDVFHSALSMRNSDQNYRSLKCVNSFAEMMLMCNANSIVAYTDNLDNLSSYSVIMAFLGNILFKIIYFNTDHLVIDLYDTDRYIKQKFSHYPMKSIHKDNDGFLK